MAGVSMIRYLGTVTAAALLVSGISGRAQNPSSGASAPPPPAAATNPPKQNPNTPPGQFTIHAESRIVLSDVMVTDSHNNPIQGLPRSAFRVFDNGKQQKIDFFQEHTVALSEKYLQASATGAPNSFSNAYLKALPPVVNIVVVDIANLSIVDQMYLYAQLLKFFQETPLDQPIAVYLRAGSGCFLVQDFTADRALLLVALRRAIPRFPPTGKEWPSDLDTMHRLAQSLNQVQGRKNVLWFSGGSTQFLRGDLVDTGDYQNWRILYDELERERIALYPIDARGLMVYPGPGTNRQHMLMQDMAHATGGQAVYNNNGIKEAAARLVDTDRNYYTITYAPQDFKTDDKYHKIKIELADGNHYRLSYREGYFADGSQGGSADFNAPLKPRTRLLSDGQSITEPDLHRVPITFHAHLLEASSSELTQTKPTLTIQPAPPLKKSKPYVIRYTVSATDLTLMPDGDKQKMVLDVASVELSEVGTLIGKRAEEIRLTLPPDAASRLQSASIVIDQPVNLRKDDKYLFLAIWDPTNRRAGTLQTPIEIPK